MVGRFADGAGAAAAVLEDEFEGAAAVDDEFEGAALIEEDLGSEFDDLQPTNVAASNMVNVNAVQCREMMCFMMILVSSYTSPLTSLRYVRGSLMHVISYSSLVKCHL